MQKRIAEWIIPLSCILLQYQAPVSSCGLIIIVIALISFSVNHGYVKVEKNFLELGFIIIVQQILAAIMMHRNISAVFSNVANVILMIFATAIVFYNLDKEKVIRNYKIVGFVCAMAIIVQTIEYTLFGIPVKSIMILPQSQELMQNWTKIGVRACGFFSEPQTYCTNIIPLLVICIHRKEYKYSLFLSFSILLTGSSLGIGVMVLIWLSLFIKSEVSRQKKFTLLGGVIAGTVAFMMLDIFESTRLKIASIFNDFSFYTSLQMTNSHSYSNYLRLIKGWVTYFELPTKEKLIGLTMNGLPSYLKGSSVTFSWSSQWDATSTMSSYFNSAAGVFIECGLFVGFVYYFFVFKRIIKSKGIAKLILVLMILQSLMTQTFFNGIFMFYMLLFYLFSSENWKMIIFKFGKK